MPLVIVGSLLIACLLVYQGIHTLRTGQTILFIARNAHPLTVSRPLHRLAYALVYIFPGVAIIAILATALAKAGAARVQSWVIGNYGMLFWSLCFSLIGLLQAVQPERMLRWTIRQHPQLADNKSVVVITRFVGIGLFLMGLAILRTL